MEPHQYSKINKMILFILEKNEYEDGLRIMFDAIREMFQKQNEHAEELLKMLSIELQDENKMNAFVLTYNKLDVEFQIIIKETYIKIKKWASYVEYVDKILDRLN